MCGIIGFIDKKNILSVKERKQIGRKMLQKIEYRGRDSSGLYCINNIVIGHNRLAIIDTSKKASQPFFNKKKTFVMSYNGEIFNHIELRKIIKDKKYQSTSDTETLVHTYEEFGNKSFELLRGMFATSFYNIKDDNVTLAMDQFGIKPLYYLDTPDWFAWSSEAKIFSLLPNFEISVNEDCFLEHGIFRNIANSETIFKGIKKLLPGEILTYSTQQDMIKISTYKIKKQPIKNIDKLLHESVYEHLLSDVPIGLQLSGGVDSSLISILASKQLNQKNVHSFSIGLLDSNWNEFKYSHLISSLIKTRHHKIIFTQREFCKLLPIATYHLDEPVSYPNTIPIMILAKKARKYVKVLLSGEGADEIFGGYLRYRRLIKQKITSNNLLFSNSFCTPKQIRSVINISKKKNLSERKLLVKKLNKYTSAYKLSIYDTKTFLPSLLLRQDKMGMASNLENRFPFLDSRLVASALSLADKDKVTSVETKVLLKKIANKYLPREIVYRKKCGFGLPISDWLKDQNGFGKYLTLFTNPKIKRHYLNYKHISKLITEHLTEKKNNSEILWILINLEIWAKIFIDKEDQKKIWSRL